MDDCSGITGLSYGDFSEWLHKKVGSQRIPIAGSLEVTMRCNLRCVHCYIPEEERAASPEPELTLLEIQRILDEVTDAGCLWMLLTGGEPFLRPDFLDIYLYAKKKGLITTIFTNGTLITPRIADFLAEWRPFNMEITLYGATQETYERVTGIPGSYAKCRRGIDLLLERGLPLGLKTMLMTVNQHELDQMKELAADLGTQFKFDPVINPTTNRSARPIQYRLSPERIVEIELADPDRSSRWPQSYANILLKSPDTSKQLFICGAGVSSFHIDSRGNLYPCIICRDQIYNIKARGFLNGWQCEIPGYLAVEYSQEYECLDCKLRLVCPQCPALASLEVLDREKRVDYLCNLAHRRAQAFSNIQS